MVQSQINPSINFPDIRYIDQVDIGFNAPLYKMELYNKPIVIGIGQINTNFQEEANIVYFPIYLIDKKRVKLQIGIFEVLSSNLSNILDKFGDLDLNLIDQPLIYSFIKSNLALLTNSSELFEKDEKKLSKISEEVDEITEEGKEVTKIIDKAQEIKEGESEEEVEEEVEEREEEDSEGEGEGEEEGIDPEALDYYGPDQELEEKIEIKPTKDGDEFKISAKEYYKEENEFLLGKTTKWIEKYFKNNNFDVINNEGGGDCLFCIIRDGLETVGIKKTVKELRISLASEASQELFENYRAQYEMYKSAIDITNEELQVLIKRNKELKVLLSSTSDRSEHKKIIEEASVVKKEFESLKEQLSLQKQLFEEFKKLKNIKNLVQFKEFIESPDYWADTWAVSTLERLLNIKLIIFSREEYNSKDLDGKPKEITVDEKNIILCGQLNDPILESRGKFEPTYYIMTEYDGVHYQLITYKKRGAFTFNQLPFKVKELVAEKCLEGESGAFVLIPDFQEFKGSQEEILEGGGLNLISDPINPLFNDNIVFLFCSKSLDQLPGKGNGEKISAKDINNFSKLAGKKDWRKKLSDLYEGDELKIDGKKWKTVEHYLNANKFKNGFPSFYNQFSLDSNSSISQNPFLAKAAGTKKGKYKDKQVRPSHIVIDEIYYTKLPEYIHKAYYTKFIQNPELKETLKSTGKSKLMKYKRGQKPEIATELMKIRKLIK
jgi:predicted NAD-dependent protein-ADP-ribosyltransferase YbiA (DUF1768 family)